ncbi:hypothetical protein [Flavihumibacter sp. ZG627]|uniref:hypothetical protein n=1 Tax=Flavihumibacter sp. ZG627 TaxID=1463156 RepID=UPI00057DD6FE|nr:hypothetical protein [Flavihumibacter sp. ZG627]KIC92595.1 hypothetical protein HY58_03455 [Flavihumibacter sp. ZG627]
MRTNKKIPSDKAFIQMSLLLLQSSAFTHAEKFIISYIISGQRPGTVCFESNSNLSAKLNMGMTTIKEALFKFDEIGILKKFTKTTLDDYGKPHTYRKLRIDKDVLAGILNKSEVKRKAQTIANHLAKTEKIRTRKKSRNQNTSVEQLDSVVVEEKNVNQGRC